MHSDGREQLPASRSQVGEPAELGASTRSAMQCQTLPGTALLRSNGPKAAELHSLRPAHPACLQWPAQLRCRAPNRSALQDRCEPIKHTGHFPATSCTPQRLPTELPRQRMKLALALALAQPSSSTVACSVSEPRQELCKAPRHSDGREQLPASHSRSDNGPKAADLHSPRPAQPAHNSRPKHLHCRALRFGARSRTSAKVLSMLGISQLSEALILYAY